MLVFLFWSNGWHQKGTVVENSKVIAAGCKVRGLRVPDSNRDRIINAKNMAENCRWKYYTEKQLPDKPQWWITEIISKMLDDSDASKHERRKPFWLNMNFHKSSDFVHTVPSTFYTSTSRFLHQNRTSVSRFLTKFRNIKKIRVMLMKRPLMAHFKFQLFSRSVHRIGFLDVTVKYLLNHMLIMFMNTYVDLLFT